MSAQIKSNGWRAELSLEFAPRPDKTVLSGRKQLGPLTVQRSFYPEGEVCHLYILHPPGGVVGGDSLHIEVKAKKGAAALLTTPGATKFYRSGGSQAHQVQRLFVESDASLEWLPQENIFFRGAKVFLSTEIYLQTNATFIGWEIQCLGRPASQELFSDGSANFSLKLFRENKPLLFEKILIQNDADLHALSGLRANPVTATLIATGVDSSLLETIQNRFSLFDNASVGHTLLDDLLVCRYIGHSTEQVRKLFASIWETIRPKTIGRAACAPRIWST